MKLYIVRHAIAEERGRKFYTNDDRPLTKAGTRKMAENAAGIATIIPTPVDIISSPLQRAFHTAEILSSALRQTTAITLSDALLPGSSSEQIMQLCRKYSNKKNIMIVGHEPSLGKFISTILQQPNQSLRLKKGSLCCIEFDLGATQRSELLLYLPPRILRAIN
jgi:phosphohistidine phosphatase